MAIQWFPGHMNATRKAIGERMKAGIDVVIELLDARLPGSSANPLLAELTRGKPTLKVLNKQDLADPERTARWLAHYNAQPETQAIGLDASETAPAQRLTTACRQLAPGRGGMDKPLRVLICGVPNVGKSTLVNTLVGKRASATGDEAGITRAEKRIVLAQDAYLFDTPGMLWPRINIPQSGYHLAASGAVGRNALDEEEVALELLAVLARHYPQALQQRYQLGSPAEIAAWPADELLTRIGRRRGAVMGGGRIHLAKAADIVLTDFRTGQLGRITLETPEELLAWQLAAVVADKQRLEKKRLQRAGKKEWRAAQWAQGDTDEGESDEPEAGAGG